MILPTINANREVHFESAEQFCALYDQYLSRGGVCVQGTVIPAPLEEVELKLALPFAPGEYFTIPGRVTSVSKGRALIQFISFGDSERTRLSQLREAAAAATLSDAGALVTARVCPACGSRYEGEAAFCSKDGAALIDGSIATPRPISLEMGSTVGSYRLTEVLGEGGMGRVYKAEHLRLGRQVAIKVLREDFAASPTAIERFFGEALAVNRIKHDHIVEITDFSDGGEGPTYYIMELLEGRTLKEVLAESKRLPLARALHIAAQVANTLEAVHSAGIIHRDLKPDNVFLIRRGGDPDFAKLLDFGVAKLGAAHEASAMVKTSAGALIGTPDYMAPEQLTGKAVDATADVYSLGVILYEMLTGRRPVVSNSVGKLVYRHMSDTPTRPTRLPGPITPMPARLEVVIMSCLAKEPRGRPSSMAMLEGELLAVAEETA